MLGEREQVGVVSGHIEPRSWSETSESHDVRRPAVILLDLADASAVQESDHLVVGDRRYRVVSGPEVFDAESSTSHCVFRLEEL